MAHHSTLIGAGKGEGCLFCSDAHKIVASVVNVLTRIVGLHGDDVISTDKDPDLRIESFAIIKIRGVSTN